MTRRLMGAVGLLLMVAGLATRAGGAEPALGGFELLATSSGLAFYYDQPSAPVPASPAGELTISYATSTLDTGPAGHAIASAAWPGSPAANVPKFARDAIAYEFISRGFPRDNFPNVPNYPVRAETFSPQGPYEARGGLPGAGEMSAHSKDQSAGSLTTIAGGSLPGVVSVGWLVASARTAVEPVVAVSEGTATVKGLSLLDGLITIDSVVTQAKATSNGAKAAVSGRTIVTGVKLARQGFINGQALELDDKGLRVGSVDRPVTAEVNEIARQRLDQAGITLLVAGPLDIVHGPQGSRMVGGLLVSFASGKLTPYVQQLPPQLRDLILQGIVLDKTVTIVLGAVFVKAGAASTPEELAFEANDFPDVFSAVGGDDASGGITQVLGEALEAPPTGDFVPAEPSGAGPESPALQPVATAAGGFGGIPAALVGFVLFLTALASGALQRLWRMLLFAAPAAAASVCPLDHKDRG